MTPTPKEGQPDVDVPLENQTRECLIALVEAMDKQAKDNEERRAALENVVAAARVINEWQSDWDEPKPFYEVELVEAIDELDALTPTPKEKEKA